MKDKKQDVQYKVNTVLLKRVVTIALIIFIISILYLPISFFLKNSFDDAMVTLTFSNSSLTIKVPRLFSDMTVEDPTDSLELAGIKTEENEEVKQDYINSLPRLIYKGYNRKNGINMTVQEKLGVGENKLTPQELAERYHVSALINYEDANVYDYEYEVVEVLESDATKVSINIDRYNSKKDVVEPIKYVAYLIPLNDKEVTVEFFGSKNQIEKSENIIQKIIKSLKNN